MKTICLYHRADLDGHCSGAVVRRKFPAAEMRGVDYYDHIDVQELAEFDGQIIIVDFSLKPGEMSFLHEHLGTRLIWIDHHVSAISLSEDNNYANIAGLREVGTAACELAWLYFFREIEVPRAVELLGNYDVWNHKDTDVFSFQYGMRSQETRPDAEEAIPLWDVLLSNDQAMTSKIVEMGEAIWDYEQRTNMRIAKAISYEVVWNDYRFLAANRSHCNSTFFDTVFDPDKHDAMVLFSWAADKQRWNISMYTNKVSVDVLRLAKQYGGGGHKGACGFQSTNNPFIKEKELYKWM